MSPEEMEREAGNVASKVTCGLQQQARDARLQPLIKSGRCKRSFPQNKKRLCFEGCNNPLLHPQEECEYFWDCQSQRGEIYAAAVRDAVSV